MSTTNDLVPTIKITWDRPPSPSRFDTYCWEDDQPEDDIRAEWKKARPGSRILKIERGVLADRRLVE